MISREFCCSREIVDLAYVYCRVHRLLLFIVSFFIVKLMCLCCICFFVLQQTMGEMDDELMDRPAGSYFITSYVS